MKTFAAAGNFMWAWLINLNLADALQPIWAYASDDNDGNGNNIITFFKITSFCIKFNHICKSFQYKRRIYKKNRKKKLLQLLFPIFVLIEINIIYFFVSYI